jgi:hypothetical protein
MMINLIDRFKVHLQAREDALRCFCDRASQVEGWFKGEMFVFLQKEMANNHERIVQNFDREVKIDGKRVDFSVRFDSHSSAPVWIELKHWLIGRQKAGSYNAGWYFRDRRANGSIERDVNKLSAIVNGEKYVMIAATAAPTQDDWQSGLAVFNRRLTENGRGMIQCLTDVNTYPTCFFLGLLRVEPA